MKVNIGKYETWFGPYQLAEALCFWVPDQKDEFGIPEKPEWVHNFGEWLAYGEVEPPMKVGETRRLFKKRKPTWLHSFLLWINSKKKRKISVRIDRHDMFSLDHTLALIILPALKMFKENHNGAPLVDNEDVPDHLKRPDDFKDDGTGNTDEHHFDRWIYVIDEMIFAFEDSLDDDSFTKFYTRENEEGEMTTTKLENGYYEVGGLGKGSFDKEAFKVHDDRVKNGLRLFGKYYRHLWT